MMVIDLGLSVKRNYRIVHILAYAAIRIAFSGELCIMHRSEGEPGVGVALLRHKPFDNSSLNPESLQFAIFPDPFYAQNGRVLHTGAGTGCWVIDPGLPPTGEQISNYIQSNGLSLEGCLLTHAHVDHIAGLPVLLEHYPGVPVYVAPEERTFLEDPTQNLSIAVGEPVIVHLLEARALTEGMELLLGGLPWQVLATPGHSPGGRTFFSSDAAVAIVGDTLFAGSVGRTDFPHSDGPLMFKCIRDKLLTLPGETRVLPGHGPDTTIEIEKRTNPFLVGRSVLDI